MTRKSSLGLGCRLRPIESDAYWAILRLDCVQHGWSRGLNAEALQQTTMVKDLSQLARLCLLLLGVTAISLGQVVPQDEIDRLKKCEISITEARGLAESITNSAEQNPEDKAKLLGSFGTLCSNADRYAAGEPFLRGALAILEKVLGPEHSETAQALNNLALLLANKGDRVDAESLYRRSIGIQTRLQESDKSEAMANLGTSLYNLGTLLSDGGDFTGAEPLFRRAIIIREKVYGPDHPDVAAALNNLANLLLAKGDYAEAEPLLRRALAIDERILGAEHPRIISALSNLGWLLTARGDYAGAEPLHRRALTIAEKALGPRNLDTAACLNNLAATLLAEGDYAGAEPLYRRALDIRENILGPEHSSTAVSLGSLAELLRAKGDYSAAEPLYRRALVIAEKALGPNHPTTASSLNNLAALLADEGNFAEAEPLYRRALSIYHKALGSEHPDTALAMGNLAGLLRRKRNYTEAEPLYRQALAVYEKILGPEHPSTARAMDTLSLLLAERGEYSVAEPLARRALAIREKALGADHPDTATSLSNLAVLLQTKGDYAGAGSLDRRALAIREKVLGPEHPDTATTLNNLAFVLALGGQYTSAEPLFRRALAISEKVSGPDSPDVGAQLYNLAALLWKEGRFTDARVVGERAGRTESTNLSRWLVPFAESEQRSLLESSTSVGVLISFQLAEPQDKDTERDVLWAILQRKGRLQEIRALQQRLAAREPELFRRLDLARHAVEACSAPTLAARNPCSSGSTYSDRYRSLNEALLALRAKVPREEQDLGVVELEEMLISLKDGDRILVEIAEYKVFHPFRPQSATWGESRYIAYVLFADGRIESKDLGETDWINATVARVRQLEADPRSTIGSVRSAARELYDETLGQLEQVIDSSKSIYIAADGDLGLVDFSSLVDRKGRWFIEGHLVVNLISGRDLVRLKRAESTRKLTRADYLVVNPSFLFKNERAARATSAKPASTEKPTLSASAFSCSVTFAKGASWPRVGITTEQIAGFRTAIPGLKVLEREQAREGAVKQIERPRSLWFMTHGFFCENAPGAGGAESLGGRAVAPSGLADDDPMARGALVLAGAQVGGTGDGEDGFLKGSEIVERDWEGTDLVVLGACETALGVPSVGDGVYGMRRALALAGVRSQVMTLWRVSQAQTFELLQDFANLLKQGKGKAAALREAQREILSKYPHPYYWAGFYFSGDPAPLGQQE